jgi:hypothetical protein
MKKFILLYKGPMSAEEQMANATPEQAKAGMDAWMAWSKKAGSAIVDLGAPLGRGASVKKGSVEKASGGVGGYSILQAPSIDAINQLLVDHPHFMIPGATIEVLEALPM